MTRTYRPLRMFGAESADNALEWDWVARRLTEAETYWVDVAGSGPRPHARPVWGVWLDDRLHLSIGTPAIRGAATPGVPASVHLPDGLDVVIVEGTIAGATRDAAVVTAYDDKYDWKYDLEQYGPFTTISASDVLAWRAGGPAGRDGFTATGRWTWLA